MFNDLQIKNKEKIFCIGYDPSTGKLLGVFQQNNLPRFDFYIKIDSEIAEKFHNGEFKPSRFVVDTKTLKLKSLENRLNEYNEVLLRIPYTTDIEEYECKILINQLEQKIKFELNSHLEYPDQVNTIFYFTKYNDPTIIYDILEVPVYQIKNNKEFNLNFNFSENNSIFTKRLFNGYGIELQ